MPKVNRRDLLRQASALGLSVIGASALGRGARAEQNLSYFTWSGYEVKELHAAFSETHGTEPDFTFFSDEEEALQKMRGGFSPDLAHPCYNTVGRFRDAGVLQPLDVDRLKNWPDVFAEFKTVQGVMADDKYWIVPFDWGTSSVIYRPDLVKPSEESWRIMVDPQHKGKISFLDAPDNVVAIAGLLTGAANPMDMNDDEMGRAEDVLRQLHANVRFYWSDQAQLEQALASGEVVAAWGWMSSVNNLKKQGIDVAYMTPKEGVMTWVCGITRSAKSAADDAKVYDFIDSMISPESGKYMIEEYGYGHSNAKSFGLASPESVAALGFTSPTDFLKTGHFFQAVDPAKRQAIVELWQKIRAS
jgi:spermidine/putrescine transport system substrate-binding protein